MIVFKLKVDQFSVIVDSEENIAKIVATYKAGENVDKYAYLASLKEIQDNDYNLNIPRYVDTFEEEAEIDLLAVRAEREQLKTKLTELEAEMAKYLQELGYDAQDCASAAQGRTPTAAGAGGAQ